MLQKNNLFNYNNCDKVTPDISEYSQIGNQEEDSIAYSKPGSNYVCSEKYPHYSYYDYQSFGNSNNISGAGQVSTFGNMEGVANYPNPLEGFHKPDCLGPFYDNGESSGCCEEFAAFNCSFLMFTLNILGIFIIKN